MKHPYQVMGTTVPQMLGRRAIWEQLQRHLVKSTTDNVSIIGPTLYGKSVVLNHLAEQLQPGSPNFVTSAYVDFRHAPPASDEQLRIRFAETVKDVLRKVLPDIADWIDLADKGLHELLDLAFHELEKRERRLLVVLDGFDPVLSEARITRNIWDQLRSLAQKASLALVTGSRRPLSELCKSEESRASDFWEIFYDTPIIIGAFEGR